jgi:site-specific DNA recombinase
MASARSSDGFAQVRGGVFVAAPPPAPRIHPNFAELYRRKVECLHETLNANDTKTEATEVLRGLIEAINVRPTNYGLEIELAGNIVNMLKLPGKGSFSIANHERSVKVVAGVGFEPTTFRL